MARRRKSANASRRARSTSTATRLRVLRRKRITMQPLQLQRIVSTPPLIRPVRAVPSLLPVDVSAYSTVHRQSGRQPLPAKQPFRGVQTLYKLPHGTKVCVDRKVRKQVLMAKYGGRGPSTKQQKKRLYNNNSEFSC